MDTVCFVERRLNKARIRHLSGLATKSGLFKVSEKVGNATILLGQGSTGYEIVDFLVKTKNLSRDIIIKKRLVDISWFIRCMKEKQVVEINSNEELEFKHTRKTEGDNILASDDGLPCTKKSRDDVYKPTVSMYSCQAAAPLNHFNKRFTAALELLEQHALYRGGVNAEARALAFHRGSASLKSFPREVSTEKDLRNIPYVGLTNSSKVGHGKKVIVEILTEGFSDEVESVVNSKFFQVMKLFCGIFGVGPSTARKWFNDMHFESLDDIKKSNINLSTDQRLGLEHYDDLNTPVSALEANYILKLVQDACESVCPGLSVTLAGGFRRGKCTGHDVDLLISHKEKGKEKGVLLHVITKLQEYFLYTDKKMSSSRNKEEKEGMSSTMDHFEKCFSIFKFSNSWVKDNTAVAAKDWKAVRVDLVVVPHDQFAFALLGWTGTKHFEREIRRYARTEKQIVLTSHGMYSSVTKESFPASNEMDIFNKLDLEYRPPSQRCC